MADVESNTQQQRTAAAGESSSSQSTPHNQTENHNTSSTSQQQQQQQNKYVTILLNVAAVAVAVVVQLASLAMAAPQAILRGLRVAFNKFLKERGMDLKLVPQGQDEDGAQGDATSLQAKVLARIRTVAAQAKTKWDALNDADRKKVMAAAAVASLLLLGAAHRTGNTTHKIPKAHLGFQSAAAAALATNAHGNLPAQRAQASGSSGSHAAHASSSSSPSSSSRSSHGGGSSAHRRQGAGTGTGHRDSASLHRASPPRRTPQNTAQAHEQEARDMDTMTLAAQEDERMDAEEEADATDGDTSAADAADEDANANAGTGADADGETDTDADAERSLERDEDDVPSTSQAGASKKKKQRNSAPAAVPIASKPRGREKKASALESGGSGGDLPAAMAGATVTESAQNLPAHLLASLDQNDVAAAGGLDQIPAAVIQPLERYDGPLIVHRGTWSVGSKIPFPRKKFRNQLTHYSLGAVSKALRDVLPMRDEVRASIGVGAATTCAVVGNGGSLLLHELGSTIDMHDVVIRLNAGPTAGYEAHVGSKTTLRLVNRLHMGYRGNDDETVLQHVSTPIALQQYTSLMSRARSQTASLVSKDASGNASSLFDGARAESMWTQTFLLDPAFHDRAFEYIDKGVLSNGMYAVILATELCSKVSVYGFYEKWRGQIRYHYFNTESPDAGQSTRDGREAARLRLFVKARPRSHNFGEPCMGGGAEPCVNCPTGSHCECGVFHPVPDEGYCYQQRHPRSTGAPAAGCMRKCRDKFTAGGGDDGTNFCPGGYASYCPNIPDVYSRRCEP